MARNIRGIEERHEQKQQQLIRDTRTTEQKITDFVKDTSYASMCIALLGITSIMFPSACELYFIISIILFLINYFQRGTLPFKLPMHSDRLDYNDIKPGTNQPNKARGITFFGNDIRTNDELWFSNEDMRTHVLIFGSTGSGKTEALISLAYNALLQGSGFIYVDGKGDNSLFSKIYSISRYMGREDDLLLLNFMTGARDVLGPQRTRLSNTMNPFASGSSSMLSQLVVSLMDDSSSNSDGDMWKGRAIGFVEALMRILTYMRDEGHILLDAGTIRDYFVLTKLESIVLDKKFPIEQRFVDLKDAPKTVTDPIYNYMINLPGFNPANKGKQAGEVFEQHGFITMQLVRAFSSLADTYGHIVKTNLAEIDFKDVVLNRRILVALLPALEKSPSELANLGKLIVASLKAMMASGLGEEVEGTYREVIEKKPTTSPTPYLCILDEYGYYAVEGFAVVPAQARSLGFSAIFAGQDLPAFQKASKEEAASIGANTNIKICMKLEDPTETLEFFVKTAGEAYVTATSGFQTKNATFTNNYLDSQQANIEKRNRIELLDLKDQGLGEGHIFFKSRIIRMKSFYANPKPAQHMRLNQMLKVETPNDDMLAQVVERIAKFTKLFDDPHKVSGQHFSNDEDLQFILDNYRNDENAVELVDRFNAKQTVASLGEEQIEPEWLPQGMNVFFTQNANTPEPFDSHKPLLDKEYTFKSLIRIEQLLGTTKKDAQKIAKKLLSDVSVSSHYPPFDRPSSDANSLVEDGEKLIKSVKALVNKEKGIEISSDTTTTGGDSGSTGSSGMGDFDSKKLDDLFKDLDKDKLSKTDFPDLPDLPEWPDLPDLPKDKDQDNNKDKKQPRDPKDFSLDDLDDLL